MTTTLMVLAWWCDDNSVGGGLTPQVTGTFLYKRDDRRVHNSRPGYALLMDCSNFLCQKQFKGQAQAITLHRICGM